MHERATSRAGGDRLKAKQTFNDLLQPESSIRWSLPGTEFVISGATRAALREMTTAGDLPEEFELEVLTSYEREETVFTVWSVRLRVPGGPHPNGTTCVVIQERMIESRIMGPREREVVADWRREAAQGIGSFAHQRFRVERARAIELDRTQHDLD